MIHVCFVFVCFVFVSGEKDTKLGDGDVQERFHFVANCIFSRNVWREALIFMGNHGIIILRRLLQDASILVSSEGQSIDNVHGIGRV